MEHSVRIQMLEQQLQVMQREVSEVLGELQKALVATIKTNQVSIAVIDARIAALENANNPNTPTSEGVEATSHEGGKEL